MKKTNKEILTQLLGKLWEQYLQRVSYAKTYTELVTQKGGKVVNDHIAFRTFNTLTGKQAPGINAIRPILEAFEYQAAGNYVFTEKKLTAIHFQHPDPQMPKIFVSQLEASQLPPDAQQLINEQVASTPNLLSNKCNENLQKLRNGGELDEATTEAFVDELAAFFGRPWKIPKQSAVEKLNEVSQYAAWTLLHGNSVNHFTAFINYQNVKEWPDLKTTCDALTAAGVPMKDSIEGQKGSKLQQSSTQAVTEPVEVIKPDGTVGEIPWTYAYYELAERGFIEENGKQILFSGFLGEQATHLFEMTKTDKS